MTTQGPRASPLPAPTGALPYGLGFLAYIPIPLVSLVIAGIVMAAVYPRQRRHGGLAAQNARYAANWGLTLIVLLVVLVGGTVLLVTGLSIVLDTSRIGAGPLVPFAIGYVAIGIAHVVVLVMGLVKANNGIIFENRIAIPFFTRHGTVSGGPAS